MRARFRYRKVVDGKKASIAEEIILEPESDWEEPLLDNFVLAATVGHHPICVDKSREGKAQCFRIVRPL